MRTVAGAQRRAWKKQMPGQSLEQVSIRGGDAEMFQFDGGMCPGEFKCPSSGGRRPITIGQRQGRLSRFRHRRGKCNGYGCPGRDADHAPQAKDGIEHRAGSASEFRAGSKMAGRANVLSRPMTVPRSVSNSGSAASAASTAATWMAQIGRSPGARGRRRHSNCARRWQVFCFQE